MSYEDESRRKHVRHVWMNERQDGRAKGDPFEHDLYEWMRALEEMEHLPGWLKREREDTLPSVHQQCSRTEPEPITSNYLVCALDVRPASCAILASLAATTARMNESPHYNVGEDDLDRTKAEVCAWHIFTSKQRNPYLDTSEGYMQDESDRRFWRTTYANMAAADTETEEVTA